MDILTGLLAADAAAPRLTCYDEVTGGRTDLNATTLDNWAAKVANMLHEEFDLEPGDAAWVDLPVIWPAACLVLGAARAGVELSDEDPLAVFAAPADLAGWEERHPEAVLAAVTDDAFGRGVVECGGEIPPGVVDFGPEVRLHADDYLGPGPGPGQPLLDGASAAELMDRARAAAPAPGARVLTGGWLDGGRLTAGALVDGLLAPWAAAGSTVVVRGGDAGRRARIAGMENAAPAGRG